jgi:hypothetical protein
MPTTTYASTRELIENQIDLIQEEMSDTRHTLRKIRTISGDKCKASTVMACAILRDASNKLSKI